MVRSPLVLILSTVAALMLAPPAEAQPPAAPPPPVAVGPCGEVPNQIPTPDFEIELTRTGSAFQKTPQSSAYRLNATGVTTWVFCNNTGVELDHIKFSGVTCQGTPPTPGQCPVDFDRPDANERCAAFAAGPATYTVPHGTWGVIIGAPNPNRVECSGLDTDSGTEMDVYESNIEVKGVDQAPQMVDPQLQVPRDVRPIGLRPMLPWLGGVLLAGALAGFIAGRFRIAKAA